MGFHGNIAKTAQAREMSVENIDMEKNELYKAGPYKNFFYFRLVFKNIIRNVDSPSR